MEQDNNTNQKRHSTTSSVIHYTIAALPNLLINNILYNTCRPIAQTSQLTIVAGQQNTGSNR
eukprot:4647262-Ditylum_brightwellii.AAC.1